MQKLPALLLAGTLIAMSACGSDNSGNGSGDSSGAGDTAIYFASFYEDNGKEIACYWKDEERIDLYNGAGNSCAWAIIISDGLVYAAGMYEDNGKYIACYWKEGTRTDLYKGAGNSGAIAIDVSDGLVYVAGYYVDGGGKYIACYWKEGARTDLYDGTAFSYAYALTVSDGSVYVAGFYDNIFIDNTQNKFSQACYWKDGERTDLDNGAMFSNARALAVSEGSVYVAGFYHDGTGKRPVCYWKNRERRDISDGADHSEARAIAVSEGLVYAAGIYEDDDGKYIACYWKEGTRTDLYNGTGKSYAHAINVSGGSVYAAGNYTDDSGKYIACYWKDGEKTDLYNGTGNSTALAITIGPNIDSSSQTRMSASSNETAIETSPGSTDNNSTLSAFAGTWKRAEFDNTLTVNRSTITISSRTHTWELLGVSGDFYTLKRPGADEMTITIRSTNNGMVISGDTGAGQENWNGTWVKQ